MTTYDVEIFTKHDFETEPVARRIAAACGGEYLGLREESTAYGGRCPAIVRCNDSTIEALEDAVHIPNAPRDSYGVYKDGNCLPEIYVYQY